MNWIADQRADASARGLWNDQTGLPTGAGMENALNQYGQGLVAGTSGPSNVAARIAGQAEKLGFSVSRDASKLSASKYLELTHDKLPNSDIKIRISDHDLPPSYGPPGDYDVHAGSPRDQSVSWYDTIKSLADKIGQPPPSLAQSAITRQNNIESAQVAAEAARKQAIASAPAVTPAQIQRKLLDETYPGDISPHAQRAARYEAEHPGEVEWVRSYDPRK